MAENMEFWAKFDRDTRSDTQIRINKGTKPLGSIIMLNPGKSMPINPEIIDEQGFRKCKPDKTMDEIKLIMHDYSNLNKGIVKIINFSDLINCKSNDFIRGKTNFKDKETIINEIIGSPWVWAAWTCHTKNKELNQLKRDVIDFLNSKRIEIIGKEGKTKYGYYHPLGILLNKNRVKIENEIRQQLIKILYA